MLLQEDYVAAGRLCFVRKRGIFMLREFWENEDAIGVVEIILILVILIALVLIFKNKITAIVNDALNSIDEDSGDIID